MIIVAYLLFCIYASLEGIRDAVVFSEYYRKINEHWLLFISRFSTALIAISTLMVVGNFFHSLILLLAFGLAFPFFQLSAYYTTYQKLGHPYYNIFSKSSTTDAKINLNFAQRLTLCLISFCLVSYLYLYCL